jgi:hypothetical protein
MRLDYRTISGAIFLQGVVFLQTLTATTSYKGNKAEMGDSNVWEGALLCLSSLHPLTNIQNHPVNRTLQMKWYT